MMSYNSSLEYYHILGSLDSIADVLKYTSRIVKKNSVTLSEACVSMMNLILECFDLYYQLQFSYDDTYLIEFNKKRYTFIKKLSNLACSLTVNEALVLNQYAGIIEIINDLCKSTISLSFKD